MGLKNRDEKDYRDLITLASQLNIKILTVYDPMFFGAMSVATQKDRLYGVDIYNTTNKKLIKMIEDNLKKE